MSVELPNKHGRGGQSALRFARLRLEKRHNYVTKVAEAAAQTFLAHNRLAVKGLVLAGAADLKHQLLKADRFDPRLAAHVPPPPLHPAHSRSRARSSLALRSFLALLAVPRMQLVTWCGVCDTWWRWWTWRTEERADSTRRSPSLPPSSPPPASYSLPSSPASSPLPPLPPLTSPLPPLPRAFEALFTWHLSPLRSEPTSSERASLAASPGADADSGYFEEVARDSGLASVGREETQRALEAGAVQRLLVWHALPLLRLRLRHPSTGPPPPLAPSPSSHTDGSADCGRRRWCCARALTCPAAAAPLAAPTSSAPQSTRSRRGWRSWS
eukprot:2118992-Rhodomonas_salina.1